VRVWVPLPHNLDRDAERFGTQVSYQIAWPAGAGYTDPENAHLALLMPRVGSRYQVLLNGHEVAQVGWRAPPEQMVNAVIQPQYVALPGGLLASLPQDNRLEILVQRERFERSGLWPMQMGAEDAVSQRYRTLMAWQYGGNLMMLMTCLLMELLAGSLWLMQRDRLYALLALSSIAHAVRLWLGLRLEPPLPFEAYFLLYRIAFTSYVGLLLLLTEELFGYRLKAVRWIAYAVLMLGPLWIGAALLADSMFLNVAWAGVIALLSMVNLMQILWHGRFGMRMNQRQILMLCVALFTLIAGVRDFLVVITDCP